MLMACVLISGCASVQRAILEASTNNATAATDPAVITVDTASAGPPTRPLTPERSPQTTEQIAARSESPARPSGCDRGRAVSVGMTVAQVYASCWGKPKSINTSVVGATKTEMLLYEGYNYLYVENGVVKSIETSGQ